MTSSVRNRVAIIVPLAALAVAGAMLASAAMRRDEIQPRRCPTPVRAFSAQAWAFSSGVDVIAVDCETIYVGGYGGTVGVRTGPLAAVSHTGEPRRGVVPELSGEVGDVELSEGLVTAVVGDGHGGWFVGGAFAYAADRSCAGLAHIHPNGSLDPTFCLALDGSVDVLARSGRTVYLGGRFTSVGGQRRRHVAAIDVATHRVTSWAPTLGPDRVQYDPREETPPSLVVNAILVRSGTVFLGGRFASVDGVPRRHLAAVDQATGRVKPFDAGFGVDAFESVTALAANARGLVAAANGYYGARITSLDSETGSPTAPPVPVVGSTTTLAMAGSTLYVGGEFDSIGGQARKHIAALDLDTGRVLPWQPRVGKPDAGFAYDGVDAIAPAGDRVYLGGNFLGPGPLPDYTTAVDSRTGSPLRWDPRANGPVLAFGIGRNILLGGGLSAVGAVHRGALVAIDGPSGRLLPWDPIRTTDGGVSALLVAHGRLYAGGSFRRVAGQRRIGLAAFELPSRSLTTWTPTIGDVSVYGVRALAASRDVVYVGGDFGTLSGEPRPGIGAVDAATGAVTGWTAPPLDVRTISVARNAVFVGGEGANWPYTIDAADPSSAELRAWKPDPQDLGDAYVVLSSKNGVYVGGWFTWIGGKGRNGLALVNANTGVALGFDAGLTSALGENVNDLALGRDGRLFMVGDFTMVGGAPRAGLAAVDALTGRLLAWQPRPPDRARSPSDVEVGGGAVISGNAEQLSVMPWAAHRSGAAP